ncbi:hypothetical protein VPH49_21915 [Pseudomonas luteola]|uniref:hypothetical protein n=1 Tax=Pseudomonas luteola TaxID=47886 RepID=UPI003A87941D
MTKPLLDIDAQLASIEADEHTGQLDLPRLTSQQKVYVAARVCGLSMTAAAKQAGCGKSTASGWEKDPLIQQYRDRYETELQEKTLPMVRFGVDDAHAMYMRAYHMAGTAGEMVKATDSLVKLHRLAEAPKAGIEKTVTAKQLADLPASELLRLASMKLDSLTPGAVDDADFEELE